MRVIVASWSSDMTVCLDFTWRSGVLIAGSKFVVGTCAGGPKSSWPGYSWLTRMWSYNPVTSTLDRQVPRMYYTMVHSNVDPMVP